MRFKLILCMAMLPPALLLAGCGMSTMTSLSPNEVDSPTIAGRSFGGQQPIDGATIELIAMGTGTSACPAGYGCPGTVLATATTDINGDFFFAANSFSCPQPDTPLYLLGYGGNPGISPGENNLAAVTAAGLGTCTNAMNTYTVMNEVTTVALAFALSHFFSTTLGGTNAENDWFGGPSTTSGGLTQYSKGLMLANSYTIPAIVNNAAGAPNVATTGYAVDAAKIYTIANVLGNCINSTGKTTGNQPCAHLFADTARAANGDLPAAVPTDTLQAAVQMALYPLQDVRQLYALSIANPPFIGLNAQPNDWTIGVSYTTPTLGLAVDNGTVSTLDIDSTGKIWFPSNAAGKAGAAYFDPASRTFNGPFNSTGLVHPQQVAIDADGYAWYNDSAATTVAGYLNTNPGSTQSVSLPNTFSSTLSIGGDNKVNLGITSSGTFRMANISTDRSSYSLLPGITFTFPTSSMAGDPTDGDAVAITDPSTTSMRFYYVTPAPAEIHIVNANDDSGQVIYTGNDDISVRSYVGGTNDGLCIYSLTKCSNFVGAKQNAAIGIAIDGASNLWVAESGDAGILNIPFNNPGATAGAVYLNSSGANNIPNNEYLHGASQGGTLITPYGIGVDAAGNVWVSNAGCTTSDCVPGSFTLSEIVGVAAPTITPVSAQITGGNLVGTEPQN